MSQRQTPIRTIVAAVVVLPILIIGLVLVTLSISTSRRIAEDLGREVVDTSTQRVAGEVSSYLASAMRVSDRYARRVRDGVLPVEGLRAWERPMLDDLASVPNVASICFGAATGEATWLLRGPGRLELGRVAAGKTDEAVELQMSDDGTVGRDLLRPLYAYDPRNRPWYTLASASQTPVWTPVYFWFGQQGGDRQTGVGYTRAVRAEGGAVRGVIVIDITLGALSDYLKSLAIAQQGAVFLLDNQGLIVAASQGAVTSAAGDRITLTQSDSAIGRALAPHVGSAASPPAGAIRVDTPLGPARVRVTALAPHPGIDWRIVTVLPESAFLSDANAVQTRSIILGVLAAVAALALGFRLSRSLSQPVIQITEHVRQVGAGHFDRRLNLRAARELSTLSDELNKAAEGLEQRVRLQQSLALATQVQQSLLPNLMPATPGLDVAGQSDYCDTTGGDYFDFMDVSDLPKGQVLVAVGDVMGHGIASALLMATARAALRSAAARDAGLGDMLSRVNDILARDARHERFMTMVLLIVDAPGGIARWASAGHEPTFVYSPAADDFRLLDGGDVPLGIIEGITYLEYRTDSIRPGEVIVIGTDGIWEAHNAAGEAYGKSRLKASIRKSAAQPASVIASTIREDLMAFLGPTAPQDDVTFVVLKVLPVPAGSGDEPAHLVT